MKDLIVVDTIIVNNEPIEFKRSGNEIFTDSLTVARVFEKRHTHVLRTIETEISQPKIGLSAYIDGSGKRNKFYLLTRDQFTLLVMSFTGAKARTWKIEYISAFNKVVESHRWLTADKQALLEDNLKLKEEAKAREQAMLPKTRETLDKTRKIHFDKIEKYFISKR